MDELDNDLPQFTAQQRDVIDDLWGMGFTLVRRKADTYLINTDLRPPSRMAYQWNETGEEVNGWRPVMADRYPGVFAPYFSKAEVQCGGLWLMERTKAEVDAFHTATHAKAHQNVEDWFARNKSMGFSGTMTVLSESDAGPQSAESREVQGDNLRTKIPMDLFPYVAELLEERDRLVSATIKASMETITDVGSDVATLRASCLNLAMTAIRKKYGLAPRIDERTKTIEDESAIPDDMLDHATTIFAVRDQLWQAASTWWGKDSEPQYQRYQELAAANPEWTRGQIMNAVLLPIAIENTRKHLEATNG